MAASLVAEQQLKLAEQLKIAADLAWNIRWHIAWDMNGDGVVTISDAGLWLKWIFFAPGDFLLLLFMMYGTPVALFLEINPDSVSGFLSGLISASLWLYLLFAWIQENW